MSAAGATAGLTLAVTSSTGVMGLAVGLVGSDGVSGLVEREIATERRHAEEISPRLQALLAEAGVAFADLDRLAIDIGPGRFTGLRVGLATVRALAFGLDIPVVGLTSLATLAADPIAGGHGGEPAAPGGPVTAVIDARRNEVFQQAFDRGVALAEPQVGAPEQLAAEARGTVVGDGLDRYLDLYRAAAAETGIVPLTGHNPKAATMLALSIGRPAVPGTAIAPLYLREPDANPNIKTRVGAP